MDKKTHISVGYDTNCTWTPSDKAEVQKRITVMYCLTKHTDYHVTKDSLGTLTISAAEDATCFRIAPGSGAAASHNSNQVTYKPPTGGVLDAVGDKVFGLTRKRKPEGFK